jgi:hypothetical protein
LKAVHDLTIGIDMIGTLPVYSSAGVLIDINLCILRGDKGLFWLDGPHGGSHIRAQSRLQREVFEVYRPRIP